MTTNRQPTDDQFRAAVQDDPTVCLHRNSFEGAGYWVCLDCGGTDA